MTTITLPAEVTATVEPAERAPSKLGYVGSGRHLLNGREATQTERTEGMIPLTTYAAALTFSEHGRIGAEFWQCEAERTVAYLWRNYDLHLVAIPNKAASAAGAAKWVTDELVPASNHVWANLPFWFTNRNRWLELLPKPSETVPGLVSYYQDANKRAANIRTPIKPGKFLQKFFADVLTQDQIRDLAHIWGNAYALREVQITQDADVIEAMYRSKYNGSCMHFGSGGYDGHCHPVRVYAGPDLGLAYLETDGVCDARAVVWPDKKVFARPYGDTARIEAALKAQGYTRGEESDFNGARLQRIENRRGDGLIMPYVDMADNATDTGDYIVLDWNGEMCVRDHGRTSGVYDDHACRCPDCGGRMTEDDRNYVEGHGDVCDSCYASSYFYCEISGTTYADSERVTAFDRYGNEVNAAECVVRFRSFFYCEGREAWFHTDRYSFIEIDGETYEWDYAERTFTFRLCAHSGECHHVRDENEWVQLDDAGDEWAFVDNLPTIVDTFDGETFDTDDAPGLYAFLASYSVQHACDLTDPDQLNLDLAT